MAKDLLVLDSIVEDVSIALYQKWYNAVPSDQINEASSQALMKNSKETTLFVVQMFMNKFNEVAEELKSQPNE